MGKRIELNPAWLVSLLSQWAIHDLRSQTGGLGYASGSSWMRGLKSSPASSIDPTGYAARDFGDVEQAMDWLRESHLNQWAAVNMYHKAWVIDTFRREGFPFQNTTYFDRLHKGYSLLGHFIEDIRRARQEVLKEMA
jgi:hypothetical protein